MRKVIDNDASTDLGGPTGLPGPKAKAIHSAIESLAKDARFAAPRQVAGTEDRIRVTVAAGAEEMKALLANAATTGGSIELAGQSFSVRRPEPSIALHLQKLRDVLWNTELGALTTIKPFDETILHRVPVAEVLALRALLAKFQSQIRHYNALDAQLAQVLRKRETRDPEHKQRMDALMNAPTDEIELPIPPPAKQKSTAEFSIPTLSRTSRLMTGQDRGYAQYDPTGEHTPVRASAAPSNRPVLQKRASAGLVPGTDVWTQTAERARQADAEEANRPKTAVGRLWNRFKSWGRSK